MSQQWLFKDNDQARQEFAKKEKALSTGILVLIEQVVYHFEDNKEWSAWREELLKNNPNQYALTNLTGWREWLAERDKNPKS